ncbi:pyridoxine/pyridoxamine 5'-phosphate oxidase [Cytobacillus sp. FSL H8-0458]|uniref:pyridoxine/pyridoxamine 5'-phosphate oxidase n=1 Tax=Cytobacillus sp. FSL H8-0458 TaxID=2975346 RepID=UPI0030FBBAA2
MNTVRDLIRQSKTLTGPFPEFPINEAPGLPHELFLEWFQTAIDHAIPEPHSVALSTIDENGAPDARVLIIKDVDQDGWYFASSSLSKKGKQIEFNPNVALTFYWPGVGRQVRIRGKAIKMDIDQSANDFLKRGMMARAIALLEKQSSVLKDQLEFEEALAEGIKRIKQKPDLVSPSWVLYRVMAKEVEFWQADEERKHIRLKYTLEHNMWLRELLWP